MLVALFYFMKKIIITNNDDILKVHYKNTEIHLIDGQYMDVLIKARDMVHIGHILLSHPLCGSLKPNENPYKSILLSKDKASSMDTDSLNIIESSIETAKKFPIKKDRVLRANVLSDFKLIDRCLIESAIESDV